jgi:hypothetical protein
MDRRNMVTTCLEEMRTNTKIFWMSDLQAGGYSSFSNFIVTFYFVYRTILQVLV